MSKTKSVALGLGIGAVVLVGGGALGMVATGSFVTINPGEVGVVYDLRNGTLDDTCLLYTSIGYVFQLMHLMEQS